MWNRVSNGCNKGRWSVPPQSKTRRAESAWSEERSRDCAKAIWSSGFFTAAGPQLERYRAATVGIGCKDSQINRLCGAHSQQEKSRTEGKPGHKQVAVLRFAPRQVSSTDGTTRATSGAFTHLIQPEHVRRHGLSGSARARAARAAERGPSSLTLWGVYERSVRCGVFSAQSTGEIVTGAARPR